MGEKSGWRNWGDHPVVVLLGAAASFITIIAFLTDKTNFENSFSSEILKTPSTASPAQLLSPATLQSTVSPTPQSKIFDSWISPKDGMVMLFVPAGEFGMGSADGLDDEKPVHMVNLGAYWIDQTEVTTKMFSKFVDETGYITDAEKIGTSKVLRKYKWTDLKGADWKHPEGPFSSIIGLNGHPVVHISWNDAKAYCEWRGNGSRLPSEAEWEKAASWDDAQKKQRVYPWGDVFNGSKLNYCDKNCPFPWADKNAADGYEFTAPVGTYPDGTSFYGAMDMAGNVWEWVADWYDAYPGNFTIDSDFGTTYRVLRGGSWYLNFYNNRSSYRHWSAPSGSDYNIGFRCARSAE